MAFQGNSDRFDPTGYKHVDRLAHKGRSKQRQNNIPYATETKTPSRCFKFFLQSVFKNSKIVGKQEACVVGDRIDKIWIS